MLGRLARAVRPVAVNAMRAPKASVMCMRSFSAAPSDDVVIPELVDTLEWVLNSPPNIHQFDEPPIVVEVEHLDALIIDEDH